MNKVTAVYGGVFAKDNPDEHWVSLPKGYVSVRYGPSGKICLQPEIAEWCIDTMGYVPELGNRWHGICTAGWSARFATEADKIAFILRISSM